MRTYVHHEGHFSIGKHCGMFVLSYKGVPRQGAYASVRAARYAIRVMCNMLRKREAQRV